MLLQEKIQYRYTLWEIANIRFILALFSWWSINPGCMVAKDLSSTAYIGKYVLKQYPNDILEDVWFALKMALVSTLPTCIIHELFKGWVHQRNDVVTQFQEAWHERESVHPEWLHFGFS